MNPSDLRPIQAAEDAVEGVRQAAKGKLIEWLPTPKECPDCAVLCEAGARYDPKQAAFYANGEAPAWICPECDRAWRRSGRNPIKAEMWDR